jgi:hypothetical protein
MRAPSDSGVKPTPEGPAPKPVPPRSSPDTGGADWPRTDWAPGAKPNGFLTVLLRALSAWHT